MTVNLLFDRLHRITESQLLLLDSLLLPEPDAGRACLHWLESVDLDKVDFASYRLIPAVYARHVQGRPLLPDYGRIKGVYRFFHVRNTLQLADTRQAVDALHAAGIEVVALKGLAWFLKYYKQPAIRAMMDADLLVSPRDFNRASEILRQLGWTYRHSDEHRRIFDHSIDFTNGTGRALDLHVRTLIEVREHGFDEIVFARSQPFDWNGLPIRIPCPEHIVMIGLINAVREPAEFRLEWICDLARALSASPFFDWAEVCRLSHAYGVAAQMFDAVQIAADLPGLSELETILPGLMRPISSPLQLDHHDFGYFIQSHESDCQNNEIEDDDVSIQHHRALASTEENIDRSDLRGTAQHMRVFESDQGDIEALFLRWALLPDVPRLFDIIDNAAWEAAIRGLSGCGAGLLKVSPGLLQRRSNKIETYLASITFADGSPPTALAPGARTIIPLRIVNRSEIAWISSGADDFGYGVSWHVHHGNGDLAVWDQPRCYFLVPKHKHLVFIVPGMAVDCRLEIVAPDQPGEYIIKLDVVHESVSWFASQEHPLPEWRLSVALPQPHVDNSAAVSRLAPYQGTEQGAVACLAAWRRRFSEFFRSLRRS